MAMNSVFKHILIISSFFLVIGLNAIEQPKELGQVNWLRDYDQAVFRAQKENKAILILFQEVPGCSTCRNYGHNVLSHPLMVEAIEHEFIPLAIFNNKGGKDKVILDRFGEPSWNNPVVRIVDAEGKDIVQRIGGDYKSITLCQRMKAAIEQQRKQVPGYLDILEAEILSARAAHSKEAHFKMYCFWNGEKQLGKLEGVTNTESGFIGHAEVVKVKYDPTVVDAKQLIDYARKQNFEPIEGNANYRIATNDVHYYLKRSRLRYIPLTELQKTKINSSAGDRVQAYRYLSPKQVQWAKQLDQVNPERKVWSEEEFTSAWANMDK